MSRIDRIATMGGRSYFEMKRDFFQGCQVDASEAEYVIGLFDELEQVKQDGTDWFNALKQAEKERDEARAEAKQLRDDSYWLQFTWLDEYSNEEQIPNHDCDFVYRPDMAGCSWHEKWFGIAERNGLMEMFAEQNMERAEQAGEVDH